MTSIVSVIVPIYNVEDYLRQCVDSILAQTYQDLEVILVDDKSTDKSGEIADSYMIDPRVRVLHTENNGVSAARNRGIENAHGEYFFFVDPDDWIEPDIIAHAMSRIGDADICCFNIIDEFETSSVPRPFENGEFSGQEALNSLLEGKNIYKATWNKLYRKECFSTIRYPEGRLFEDIATTYRLIHNATRVVCTDQCGYHYRRSREGSILHTRDRHNIMDNWVAFRDQFYYCKDVVNDKAKSQLLKATALAVMRAWSWRNSVAGMREETDFYKEISIFSRKYFPYRLRRQQPPYIHLGLLLARYNNAFSFWLANKVVTTTFRIKGKPMAL